jgi:hypothetical protein
MNFSKMFAKLGIERKPNEPLFFDEIIGCKDIKRLFRMALNSAEPVHILLSGPPASAKTLFLQALMKLKDSYFVDGSNTTKSGMIDYIFDNKPKYLLLDEKNNFSLFNFSICLIALSQSNSNFFIFTNPSLFAVSCWLLLLLLVELSSCQVVLWQLLLYLFLGLALSSSCSVSLAKA